MSLVLSSPAFEEGQSLPARLTCEGADLSPPLVWSGAPSGTKSFALIVDDPDAPDPAAPKMTYVHWVVFNLPESVRELPEGVAGLPSGACEGMTDSGALGYGGPCPPIGTHRYYHKLYALDCFLELGTGADKPQLLQAMEGHVLAEASLMGVYKKSR